MPIRHLCITKDWIPKVNVLILISVCTKTSVKCLCTTEIILFSNYNIHFVYFFNKIIYNLKIELKFEYLFKYKLFLFFYFWTSYQTI